MCRGVLKEQMKKAHIDMPPSNLRTNGCCQFSRTALPVQPISKAQHKNILYI